MNFEKINRCIEQDPFSDKKYHQVFKEYYTPLCRYCVKMVHDKDTAEDIVQELMVYIWIHRDKFFNMENPGPYLYRSVKNRSINYLKMQISTISDSRQVDLRDAILSLNEPDPQELLENKELSEIIQIAIEKLPVKCRVIFNLKRFENMSNKDIAEKLGISVKTVEAQTTIAIKKLSSVIIAKWDILIILLVFFIFL